MSSTDRFKFRVWDYDAGEYINDGALLDGRTGRISGNGEYAVEQCTGLRDKNGKLIYEGDVVRLPNGFGGEVAWWDGWWIYDRIRLSPLQKNIDGIEIIGHIHEVKK